MIGQTGMARALGLSPRGNALPRFLGTIAMADFGGAELMKKLENPLKFQWSRAGAGTPPVTVFGSNAALLIDICQAIAEAAASGLMGKLAKMPPDPKTASRLGKKPTNKTSD